ncbi:lmo0937 family membrane protein [Clostridium sp.]|uniref:lmo0937 family membrane protein n=1 Tax=Clostridium sp. TaxID=1506 RepID=UPI003464077F
MTFLKWLAAVAVFFWVLGLMFNVGGYLINILLVAAAVIFLIHSILGREELM